MRCADAIARSAFIWVTSYGFADSVTVSSSPATAKRLQPICKARIFFKFPMVLPPHQKFLRLGHISSFEIDVLETGPDPDGGNRQDQKRKHHH